MVGGHLRPAAGEFDARGPRFGPGRVFRRVIGKKFEVGADGTRVVGGVFGVALSDGNIGSEVYGDSGAAFEMFDTIFQLLERFQPHHLTLTGPTQKREAGRPDQRCVLLP